MSERPPVVWFRRDDVVAACRSAGMIPQGWTCPRCSYRTRRWTEAGAAPMPPPRCGGWKDAHLEVEMRPMDTPNPMPGREDAEPQPYS